MFAGVRRTFASAVAIVVVGIASLPHPALAADPTVTITSPAGSATVAGTISITATASVTAPATVAYAGITITGAMSSYSVTLGGNAPTSSSRVFGAVGTARYAWTTNATSLSFSTDTSSWPNGAYSFTVYVEDSAGGVQASTTVGVTVTNPTITWSAPNAASTVKGSLTFTATAAAGASSSVSKVGISISGAAASYSAQLNGGSSAGSNVSYGTAGTAERSWNTSATSLSFTTDATTWTNGTITVTLYVQDAAGRAASSSRSFTLANANPTMTVTSPASGTRVTGSTTMTVTAAPDPTGTANIAYVGVTISGATTNYSVSLSGYYSSTDRTFGSAGVARYWWSTSARSLTFTTDASTWLPGTHLVTFFVQDTAGRVGTSSPLLLTVPGPSVTINTPPTGSIASGPLTISATATPDLGVSAVNTRIGITISPMSSTAYTVQLNGAAAESTSRSFGTLGTATFWWTTSARNLSFTTDTSAWINNNYTVTVYVEESTGKVGSTSILLTTTNTAPLITNITPANASTIKGVATITASVAPQPSLSTQIAWVGLTFTGVTTYQAQLSGRSADATNRVFGSAGTAAFAWQTTSRTVSFTTDTTPWPNGTYTFRIFVQDSNGNVKASSPITVTTNNLNPTITVTSPSNNTLVRGVLNVRATAAVDSGGTAKLAFAGATITGATSYAMTLDGRASEFTDRAFGTAGSAKFAWTSTTTSITISADTTAWTNGNYTLTLYVQDSNGRVSASSVINFTTSNLPPTVLINTPGNGPIYRGQLTITATTRPDLPGTARIAYLGIKIPELSASTVELTGTGAPNWPSRTFGDQSTDLVWSTSTNSPTFIADTRQWAYGTYNITVYAEDSNGRIAASAAITITLRPPQVTTLRCSLPSSAKVGQPLTGRCTSSLALTGAPITIQVQSGKSWTTLRRVQLNGKAFTFPLRLTKPGTTNVRAALRGTPNELEPATSNIAKVSVAQVKTNRG